jgi:hypothetical protein
MNKSGELGSTSSFRCLGRSNFVELYLRIALTDNYSEPEKVCTKCFANALNLPK